ncbi:MAG TPA: hypothetical protein VF898_03430 [Chloroflexota bacterium]
MSIVTNFLRFWYDFIIGDDWLIALVVALALIVIKVVANTSLWWLLPLAVVIVLASSLVRATRA